MVKSTYCSCWGFVPSTLWQLTTVYNSSSRAVTALFWPQKAPDAHMVYVHKYRQIFKKTYWLSFRQAWWHMLLIPTQGRQRQMDLWVQGQLVYRASSRPTGATQRNPVSKKKTKQTNKNSSNITYLLRTVVLYKRTKCLLRGLIKGKVLRWREWPEASRRAKKK